VTGRRQEARGKRQKIILPFFSLMIQKRLFNLDFTGFFLFPVPCSLRMSKSENKCYKILRAVINAQHNTGQYFAGGI